MDIHVVMLYMYFRNGCNKMHVGKITNENRIVDMDTIWFPYCEPERSLLHQNATGCALQSLNQHNLAVFHSSPPYAMIAALTCQITILG